jgi:hypothetical protein
MKYFTLVPIIIALAASGGAASECEQACEKANGACHWHSDCSSACDSYEEHFSDDAWAHCYGCVASSSSWDLAVCSGQLQEGDPCYETCGVASNQ